jgi:hypothetical protein
MSPLDDSRARPRRAATADSISAPSDESTDRPELVELVLGRNFGILIEKELFPGMTRRPVVRFAARLNVSGPKNVTYLNASLRALSRAPRFACDSTICQRDLLATLCGGLRLR